MKNLLVATFLALTATGFAQSSDKVKFINLSALSTPKGYSHAVIIDLGTCTMVIMSGQVALDSAGNIVGKNDIAQQTEQVFKNIQALVAVSGGTMDNIIKLGYYVLDVSQLPVIRDVRNKFINQQQPPASTLVQVTKLFRDDVMIEIEATAIIPKK